MADQIKQQRMKSLRVIDAKLYHYITSELNDIHNIHSYDIEVLAVKENAGLKIAIRFGEDYAHLREAYFSKEALESRSKEFNEFLAEVADQCKDTMVKDYFKMMKP